MSTAPLTPQQPTQPATPTPTATQQASGTTRTASATITEAISPDDKKKKEQKDAATEPNNGSTLKAYMRVKIGKLEFNSADGSILSGYVWLSTDRFSEARIVIDDPDSATLLQLKDQEDVEIEMGFVDGERRNKFVGKVMRYGRKLPFATVVIAVDPASSLAQQQGPATSAPAEKPAESQKKRVAGKFEAIKKKEAGTIAQKGIGKGSNTIAKQEAQAQQEDPPSTSSTGLQSLLNQIDTTSQTVSGDTPQVSVAEQNTVQSTNGLQFASNSTFSSNSQGKATPQQGKMAAALADAAAQGDVVVTRGNTVRQVQPGRGDPSGLVLDYEEKRAVFIGRPEVLKKTPLQLMSGYGALMVTGYSSLDKQPVGATVVVPGEAPAHPTGNIAVPEWGQIKLSDPIYPGCLYTWADATKNGTRVPESKSIMEGIVRIAQAMQDLSGKYNGGKAMKINSWYRDPASNRRVGGASKSRHLQGDAVDFYHPDMSRIHRELAASWNGGVAIKPGSFVHIDTGSKRRWTY